MEISLNQDEERGETLPEGNSGELGDVGEPGGGVSGLSAAERAFVVLRELGVEVVATEDEAATQGGFTMGELETVVESLKAIKEGGAERFFGGQWSKHNGRFSLIGDTVPELPPGYYDMSVDTAGTLWFNPVRARTDELLRFPDAATDKILGEMEIFWERREVFHRFGLPHKRGILLYGPPGSGKTCTLQLLARDVVKRGGIVLIYEPEIFIHAYRQVRHIQPYTPIVVLMEDIDATLERHDESTVLNTLDGADTIERTVFVATTNYPEKLGERIINRPSRFDRRIFVGDPSVEARRMYLNSMTKDRKLPDDVDVERMVRDTEGMSLAHVKELFVMNVVIGAPYSEAIGNLKEMHFVTPTSADDRDKHGATRRARTSYI